MAHALLLLPLLVAQLAGGIGAAPGWAEPQPPPVELRCRLDGGPWRDCQMRIERLGERWSLVVGQERVWFVHDGRGLVRMQRGEEDWTPVEARWTPETALCWDGICAKGDIPLD